MRSYLLLIFCLIPSLAVATIDYQLDINLIPETQLLSGKALISSLPGNIARLNLKLAENCKILSVQQSGEDIPFQFHAGQLTMKLHGRDDLSISYQGRFTDQVATTPIHNEDPSYGVSATISARGVYLSAGAAWYPQLASEDIRYQLSVSAPAGMAAVTSGRRTSFTTEQGKSFSSWEIDYPLYGLTLAAGAYQVFTDNSGPVPIYAYFYAQSEQFAQLYLQEARSYLELYQELFGAYPFSKFAIVENFFPTGYGFPSWTLLGSSVIKLPFIVKTSLGHEIAHSWWGTGVRVDYSQGNWAEGLTTYVADYLYKERSSAAEAHEYRLKILRDYASLVGPASDFPVSRFLSRQDKASQAIGYGKVAMLFHMLRQQIGEEAFWQSLKTIALSQMFQQVGWREFEAVFSETSGVSLGRFFKPWLERTGGPEISLQQVRVEKYADKWQVRGVLSQKKPYYQLPVQLQLRTEDGLVETIIETSQGKQDFNIQAIARPVTLTADPETQLFRILAPIEIPATINSIRGSNNLLIIKAGKLQPPAAAIGTLLGGLRKSDLPIKSLAEVTAEELAAHDLLVLGVADTLQPDTLEFTLASGELNYSQQKIDPSTQSAVIVQKNPYSTGHNACWFISKNQQAPVVARKIPHYGKYSYLLFEQDRNVEKIIFTPETSPMRVDLSLQSLSAE